MEGSCAATAECATSAPTGSNARGLSIAASGRIWDRWCVYQFHAQAERTATYELTRKGYRTYLPLTVVRRQDPVIRSLFHKIRVPLFPGYGFIELGETDPWVPIRYTAGVRDILLGDNGRPGSVETGFVERLMAGDAARCDLASETMPPHAKGLSVRITEGAFDTLAGRVVSCDGMTTTVDVALFGRTLPVRLDRAIVVAA